MNINFTGREIEGDELYPLTATRNAADIRIGILTIREKWSLLAATMEKELTINGNIIPTHAFVQSLLNDNDSKKGLAAGEAGSKVLRHPWEIFQLNDWALREDFQLLTKGRQSQPVPVSNKTINPENIFIEEGAKVEHSIINASAGPVYIGKNAEVMEGCMIRGPFALCEGATVKMGSKIYGATTIGPYCIVAGEIKNSILFGYSNKAHDGYLGDSVIGEWCNLGAGTTNSNVKNTATEIRVWDNATKEYIPAGIKCGLLMGDYSRAAINTSFNTGSVVGVCCNIFGAGFPPKFTSDFTWGTEKYSFEKALRDIDNWKKLKGHSITAKEKEILSELYNK